MLAWPLQTFFATAKLAVDARLCVFAQVGALAHRLPHAVHAFNRYLSPANSRASVGVGLSLGLANARINLNVSTPVRAAPLDNVQSFQLGVQLQFGD